MTAQFVTVVNISSVHLHVFYLVSCGQRSHHANEITGGRKTILDKTGPVLIKCVFEAGIVGHIINENGQPAKNST